jgi:hypothetical protein
MVVVLGDASKKPELLIVNHAVIISEDGTLIRFVVPPAMLPAIFADMERRVGVCLRAEGKQFQHVL